MITIYANLFGAGLFLVFAAAAVAMLVQLGEAEPTEAAWWRLWDLPWHLVALLVCSLPYILAFCAVNLYRWSAFSRYDFRLLWQRRSANPSLGDEDWRTLGQRAEDVWNYESRRFSESRRMASLHGLLFGLVSSLTLFICTMILARYLYGTGADASKSELALVAMAVATATAFAFANDLGRILFRVALRDAGAEIFSFATKNSILVVASALLFSTLLCSGLAQINQPAGGEDHAIPLGVPGFIVIGATIAILGGRAVRFVSDRAAGVLGLGAARAAEISDLTQIEGLGEEDIERLAEEGVDSLHALAFVPLPRLLFNTKYGLERLCDWQDQALLLAHVGQPRARLLREHLLVRGAIAAQDAARRFFSGAQDGGGSGSATAEQPMQDKLANLLGFASYEHARFALNGLASDEVVNRLRVYATAAHTLEWSDDEDGGGEPVAAISA
ncbi:MAG TPA: hypothetical protein VF469_08480 [Kofleriaceae bacterium]